MKKVLKVVLPLLLAVGIVAGTYWYFFEYRPALPVDYYVSQAQSAAEAGNYSRALRLYRTALKITPDDPALSIALADTYRDSGNYTKAEYTLACAISETPEQTALYLALSQIYVEQDKLLDAEQLVSLCAVDSVRTELEAQRPAAPQIQPDSGAYASGQTVSLSFSGGAAYLTIGDYPTTETPYTEPVALDSGETTVQAMVVGDNGLVSPVAEAEYTVGSVNEPAEFADTAVEAAVREQLDLGSDDPIMTDDLRAITEFTIPEDAQTLSDLQYFEGLETLHATGLSGLDLTPIGALPALKSLDLSGSDVDRSDLKAIGECVTLEALSLENCGISSVSGLSGLTNLRRLHLGGNSVASLDALSGLTGLQLLDLRDNAVSDLTPCAGMSTLTELDAENCPVKSIAPLAGLQLESLDITGCRVSELTPLAQMTALQTLLASGNLIQDAAPLAGCTALEKVNLSNNQLTSLASFADLPALTTLTADYNDLTELPAFDAASLLVQITVSHNNLTDVSGLKDLEYLNYLDADYNSLTSLDALADCPNLVEVDAFDNPIDDVTALTEHGIIVHYTPEYVGSGE